MSSIASHRHTSVVGTLFHDFTATIAKFFHGANNYFSTAKAEKELLLLDDHMLADIGVLRSDIRFAVRQGRRK